MMNNHNNIILGKDGATKVVQPIPDRRSLKDSEDRELQDKAKDIMDNDWDLHVRDLLYKRITNEKTRDEYYYYNNPERNPLTRIASINTVVFSRETYRATDDDGFNTDFHKYVDPLDVSFAEAEFNTNGMGDCFIMPYWDAIKERIRHEVILPTQIYDIRMNRSTVYSIIICYDTSELVGALDDMPVDEHSPAKLYVEWLHDGTYKVYDAPTMKDPIKVGDSGYGEIPIVWFSLTQPSAQRPWSVYKVKDLVEGTIEIGWLEMLQKRTDFRRSYRQPSIDPNAGKGPGQGKINEVQFGPNEINKVPLQYQDTVDPSAQFLEIIEKKEAYLAATRGISSQAYFQKYGGVTAESVHQISSESRQIWKKSIKRFVVPERQYMDLIVKFMNKWVYKSDKYSTDKLTWTIDHVEPIPELDDPKVAREVRSLDIESGADNIVNWVLRHNPEFQTYDNAKKYIEDNVEVRNEILMSLVERNIPKTGDTPQGVKTVEENGRDGGIASAITRSATGADGANQVPGQVRDTGD